MKYQYPIKNHKVSCEFGKVGSWQCGWHIGVDLVGDRDIFPIAQGVVESINSKGKSYGNHVVIKHDDGLVSLYAHLSEVKVKVGQKVCLDTLIGLMGDTGNATGVHLHLELHNGAYKYPAKGSNPYTATWIINPLEWIEDHIGTDESEPSEWAQADWDWCKENGYLDGTRPHDALTREEMAAVIRRIVEKLN